MSMTTLSKFSNLNCNQDLFVFEIVKKEGIESLVNLDDLSISVSKFMFDSLCSKI